MNLDDAALNDLITGIMLKSKIRNYVPMSESILRKRVTGYVTYILDTLIEHHPNILDFKMWGAFSFDCTKALRAMGDLGSKRKYGYAWTTFQEHIGFLEILEKGDSSKKRVSDCVINPKYIELVRDFKKTLEITDLYKGYDKYFNQAQFDVPVDVDNLKKVLSAMCYSRSKPATEPVKKKDKKIIELLIYAAENNNGCVPHYYECCGTGRLYGKGILNLQTLPKRIRYAALPNCYVYDLQAGAFSLLAKLAIDMDSSIKTDCINDYIEHRNYRRKEIAGVVFKKDFSSYFRGIIKEAFTAIGFGAKTQTINQYGADKSELIFSLDKIFNTHKFGNSWVNAFLEHEYVAEFIEEFDAVKKVIINQFWDSDSDLELVKGCIFERYDDQGKRNSKSEMLAHIYQSLERRVLAVMDDCAPEKSVLLLVHDGIVTSEKIDMLAMNEAMRSELGWELAIDLDVMVDGKAASSEQLHTDFMRKEYELSKGYKRLPFSFATTSGSGVMIPNTNIEVTGDDYADAIIQALNE